MINLLAAIPTIGWVFILFVLFAGLVYIGYRVGVEDGLDQGFKDGYALQKKAGKLNEIK